ncbi:MAG: enoyl-CoA hydratase/isomerase family protein [Gammaproteobacteria bacterium]|nr:enoyl-CoA hydratase/isomerase family protein [Gammaproteobacteria bacterium]
MNVIRYELDGDVALWVLDNPQKSTNTIDQAFLDDLDACIQRLQSEAGTRGAVITSAKSLFLAGADLNDLERNDAVMSRLPPGEMFEQVFSLSRLLRKLETCGKPVACAINGTAMGGGLEIALACHQRFIADLPALQIGLPEVQIGLLPAGGGTQRLSRMLGIQAAMPYLLEGKSLDPQAALAARIVDAVVPPAELLERAKAWVRSSPDCTKPWDRKDFRMPGGAGSMDPRVAGLLVASNSMVHEKTADNLPAPQAILSCLYEGPLLPMDVALRLECKYMTRLLIDGTTRNMVRTLFVNKTRCEKLVRRPAGVPATEFRKVGVIGSGLMGAGIAQVAARSGLEVVLLDVDLAAAERGKAGIAKRLSDSVAKGRLAADKAEQTLARILPAADHAALRGAQLVVEAVFEDRTVKSRVIAAADAALGADAVLASNTSTLPITGLAALSKRPKNFIGLHFFSPVDRMPLVEVIRGKRSSDATLARALDFVQRLRKTPIVVNDSRGFFTSRFFGSYVNEGIAMVGEGVAPALIENVARMLGMPVGPLAVQDEVGLDLAVSVTRQTQADLGEGWQPGRSYPIVEKLSVELGRQGRKSGGGFYDYPSGGRKRLWSGLGDIWPQRDPQPAAGEVRKRLLHIQLLEAIKCMQEGVIDEPADGDVGAVFGVGFPAYTGGPFSYIDHLGAARVLRECNELAKRHGERFKAPRLLREMVRDGRRFYPAGGR